MGRGVEVRLYHCCMHIIIFLNTTVCTFSSYAISQTGSLWTVKTLRRINNHHCTAVSSHPPEALDNAREGIEACLLSEGHLSSRA